MAGEGSCLVSSF